MGIEKVTDGWMVALLPLQCTPPTQPCHHSLHVTVTAIKYNYYFFIDLFFIDDRSARAVPRGGAAS
jgi:hypothetical protein